MTNNTNSDKKIFYGSNRKSIEQLSYQNQPIEMQQGLSKDVSKSKTDKLNNYKRMTMDNLSIDNASIQDGKIIQNSALHTFPISELMVKHPIQSRNSGLEDFISQGDIPQVPLIDETYQSYKEQLRKE